MQLKTLLAEIYTNIAAQKFRFLGVFFLVVLISYAILFVADFIPEPIDEESSDLDMTLEEEEEKNEEIEEIEKVEDVESKTIVSITAATPDKIIFDSLDKEVTVLNPASRTIADLDAALLEGVVRHPDSADFKNTGNIFILGHSSYLPNVFNKNFQAFNGIQDLKWGDTIRLQSIDTEYVYRVDKVYKATASEVVVPIDNTKKRLTLATCNSFGSKDDRFMVEATLVKTEVL